jgi:hypothetical protein
MNVWDEWPMFFKKVAAERAIMDDPRYLSLRHRLVCLACLTKDSEHGSEIATVPQAEKRLRELNDLAT